MYCSKNAYVHLSDRSKVVRLLRLAAEILPNLHFHHWKSALNHVKPFYSSEIYEGAEMAVFYYLGMDGRHKGNGIVEWYCFQGKSYNQVDTRVFVEEQVEALLCVADHVERGNIPYDLKDSLDK